MAMLLESQSSLPEPAWASGSYKVVSDPVHKSIVLRDGVREVIDTPQFQRLRELKQLGSAYYVFPGAAHNRFEHSLGVSWLSGNMLEHLASSQPELRVTEEEQMWVRIAGAVHDLGHGPFSHVFDSLFVPSARPDRPGWSHEVMSMQLLDLMLDENGIEMLDYADGYGRNVVKNLVFGLKPPGSHAEHAEYRPRPVLLAEERPWLFEIVANGRTGIDTDKFDYLARDTHNLGMTSAFDHNRLLYSSRVIHGHVAFHAKEVLMVYTLFHTRYMLFKQIYVHRATKSIEFMLNDIMLEADRAWARRLSKSIDSPSEYAELTDCILREVEISKDPSLAGAREIVRDLRRRRLYRFVDEYLVPIELMSRIPKVRPEDVASFNPTPSTSIQPHDVIVHDVKFNYGKGEENPVDYCRFYRDFTDEKSFRIPRDKVSHLLPHCFQERVIRVYSRNRDQAVIGAMQQAFRRFLRQFKHDVTMEPDVSSRVWSQLPLPEHLQNGVSSMSPQADTPAIARAGHDDGRGHRADIHDVERSTAAASPTGFRRGGASSMPAAGLSFSQRSVPAPAMAVHAPLRKHASPGDPRVRRVAGTQEDDFCAPAPSRAPSGTDTATVPLVGDGVPLSSAPALNGAVAMYALPGSMPSVGLHDDSDDTDDLALASTQPAAGVQPAPPRGAGAKRSASDASTGTIHAYFGGSQRSEPGDTGVRGRPSKRGR